MQEIIYPIIFTELPRTFVTALLDNSTGGGTGTSSCCGNQTISSVKVEQYKSINRCTNWKTEGY